MSSAFLKRLTFPLPASLRLLSSLRLAAASSMTSDSGIVFPRAKSRRPASIASKSSLVGETVGIVVPALLCFFKFSCSSSSSAPGL
jgi:hypothetical protein